MPHPANCKCNPENLSNKFLIFHFHTCSIFQACNFIALGYMLGFFSPFLCWKLPSRKCICSSCTWQTYTFSPEVCGYGQQRNHGYRSPWVKRWLLDRCELKEPRAQSHTAEAPGTGPGWSELSYLEKVHSQRGLASLEETTVSLFLPGEGSAR